VDLSTNQPSPKKRSWSIILYIVIWSGLLAAIGYAVWIDIIDEPSQASQVERLANSWCKKSEDNHRLACEAEFKAVVNTSDQVERLANSWCKKLEGNHRLACEAELKAVVNSSDQQVEDSTKSPCEKLQDQLQLACRAEFQNAVDTLDQQISIGRRQRLWLILLSLLIGIPPLLWTVAKTVKDSEEHQRLWLVTLLVLVLLITMAVVTIAVWDVVPDPTFAYVPLPILQWGLVGGILAVIKHLALGRYKQLRKLYPWIVARPILGLFMGGVIYFIALAGGLLVNAQLDQGGHLQSNLWLNAVAFMAAFNERFSEKVLGWFFPEEKPQAKKEDDEDSHQDER
jgi:hypothetical protein